MRSVLVLVLLAGVAGTAPGQSTCPQIVFPITLTVSLKPTATSHIDVVRQPDGSYTGFEVTDAATYRKLAETPHFERYLGGARRTALVRG